MARAGLADRFRLTGLAASRGFHRSLLRFYSSPLYRWRFSGAAPDRLLIAPQDIRTADPTVASEIYAGTYSLAGCTIACKGGSPFEIPHAPPQWRDALHGFSWLRHLRAANSSLARQHARALVDEWIKVCGGYDRAAWRPRITARRLISWLSHAPLILDHAPPAFYRRFLRSLSRQARFLYRTAPDSGESLPRLTAAVALTMAGLSMNGRERLQRRATQWLEQELAAQILPDGGHVSRNPQAIVEILLDLLPLAQLFNARDLAPPQALISAVDRMMPMLRFFRLGDGGLTRFNGASTARPDTIATLLAYDEARGEPVVNARHSGYARMFAGMTILVADTGGTPPHAASADAHAGPLSFEFSHGPNPIVVNCGAPVWRKSEWHAVCRATAAHSTATLNDTSACRFVRPGLVHNAVGALIMSGPSLRVADLQSDGYSQTLSMVHDGYAREFGIVHRRRIQLSGDGWQIAGEDLFKGRGDRPIPSRSADRFAIRFHLHPAVMATLDEDGRSVLLELPGSAPAWRFHADNADIAIEESVFLAGLDGPRRTEQIVLSGRCRLQPRVSWSFGITRA
ncbi:MAG: heparinase II/III family protein [Flavobacteriaceae bacterium]